MKLIRLMLIVFAIGYSIPSKAAVTTMGTRPCGVWIKDHAQPKELSWSALADDAWLTGMLSGIALGLDMDFLSGADGAIALSRELKKKMH